MITKARQNAIINFLEMILGAGGEIRVGEQLISAKIYEPFHILDPMAKISTDGWIAKFFVPKFYPNQPKLIQNSDTAIHSLVIEGNVEAFENALLYSKML